MSPRLKEDYTKLTCQPGLEEVGSQAELGLGQQDSRLYFGTVLDSFENQLKDQDLTPGRRETLVESRLG